MENLLTQLRLRCSEKDKWVLLYFMLGLDCSVCILDSLFYTSLAFLSSIRQNDDLGLTLQLVEVLRLKLTPRLGLFHSVGMNESSNWENGKGVLELAGYRDTRVSLQYEGSSCEIRLLCTKYNGTFLRTYFTVNSGILYFAVGYIGAPKSKFVSGLFEWFIDNCIEETVNFYLQ